LERGLRGPWRLLAPEFVDQPIRRDHLAYTNDQGTEQPPLQAAAERDRPLLADDFEGPKDPEVEHVHSLVAPGTNAG
jgi:hypothetical protein